MRRALWAFVLTLCCVAPCFAWTHGKPPSSSLGINLDAVSEFTPELPFLDLIKIGQQWGTSAGTTTNIVLDVNGYPTSVPSGSTSVNMQLFQGLPLSQIPSGHYAVLYSGTGTLTYADDASAVCQACPGAGRDIINVTPSSGIVKIEISGISGGAYITGLHLVYSPDSTSSVVGVREALFNSGEMFNPDFLKVVRPFKRFRFVDWMVVNNNPVTPATAFSARSTVNQPFWDADQTVIYSNGPAGGALAAGVPIEVMVQLCNELNADAWFNMPTLATASYIASFGTLVYSLLKPPLKVYVEDANEVWAFNANTAALAVQGAIDFPSASLPGINEFVLMTMHIANSWKAAFGSDAASRLVVVMGGQAAGGNMGGINQAELLLTATSDGCTTACSGIGWTGAAYLNVQALGIAPYFGYNQLPTSWSADADGGMAKIFTEINSGGVLPQAVVTGNCGNGAGKLCNGTTNYTLTSGLSLPSTPANQTVVCFTWNSTNAANPTLAVDGGTAFQITSYPGHNIGASSFGSGAVTCAAFTNATSNGAVTGSWVLTTIGSSGGMITESIGWISTNNATMASCCGSLPLVGYEDGQSLFDTTGGADTAAQAMIFAANRDFRMGTATVSQLNQLKSAGFTTLNYYNDISAYGEGQAWGSLEYVTQQPTAPKYNAIENFN